MATYMSMPWKPPQELQYQQPQGQPLPGLPPIVQGPSLQVGQGLTRPYQPPERSFTLGGQPATPSPWVSVPGSAFPNAGMEYQTVATGDPADTTGPQTKNPDGSSQHGGTPITPAAAPAATPDGSDWYNNLPEWTQGGGYQYGWDYNQATGKWTPGGPKAVGSIIGAEVGWKTPLYLPVAYNPAADTFRAEYGKTGGETAIQRAIRQTADYARAHPGTNAQHYFEYVLASLATQNQGTGLDGAQFNPVGYGVAYDPNAVYTKGSNPWTGQPNGNAQGKPGTLPTAQVATPGAPPPVPPPAAGPPQEAPVTQQKPGDPTGNGGNAPLGTPTTYGATTLSDPIVTATGLASDPTMAGRFVRMAQGLTGPTTSRMGKLRDQLYGRMLAAYLNLSGPGAQPTDLGSFITHLGAGDIIPTIQAQARNALAGNTGGMDDTTMEQLLGYASALGGVGTGSIGQAGLDFGLQGLLTGQMDADITGGGQDTTPLYQRYANSPFRSALERYLQTVTQH